MRSRRKLHFWQQIWWDNDNNKKFYAYVALVICIIIGIILGGYQLNFYLKKRQVEEKEYQLMMERLETERQEKETKRKAEYESWKSNPNNGYEITKRQIELEKQRKQEIENYYKNEYKIGDKIIVLDLDYYIPYEDSFIADRIDVDVIRGIKDNGIIIGDCGTYSRDYIRKPFSKSEYRELLNKKLSGQLISVREETNNEY